MNFETAFPERYLLNLARRQDRRVRCEDLFKEEGLTVERSPAIDAKWVRRLRGYAEAGRYAHAITTRLAIRKARQRQASAVFLFEDDVVFHPDWRDRLAQIELPEDWGIFYLGCQHQARPEVVRDRRNNVIPGLVRVSEALDTHAWGIRADYYDKVMSLLRGRGSRIYGRLPPADVWLALSGHGIPMYAAYPNLAWQKEEASDLVKGVFSNYHDRCGTQKVAQCVLSGVLAETLSGKRYAGATLEAQNYVPFYRAPIVTQGKVRAVAGQPLEVGPIGKIAFLFLTRGDHFHARMWEEYWQGHEGSYSIYAHSAERRKLARGWLRDAQISENIPTAWGDISLVRAELALLKEALRNGDNSHFVFLSESCVPIRPWGELQRALALDGRSWFATESVHDLWNKDWGKACRPADAPWIPANMWAFHSQWVLLNREAAELVVEDDFTEYFAKSFAADEAYVATVLRMKGYPIGEKVRSQNPTYFRFPEQAGTRPHPLAFPKVTADLAVELATSGRFFARKFPSGSNIRNFKLHVKVD
jgi:hypothetical protein